MGGLAEEGKYDFTPYGDYADERFEVDVDSEFFSNYRRDEGELLLARVDGEVVGFMCYQPDCERGDYPVEPPYTLLSLVAVSPSYRDLGVGRAFLEWMVERHDDGDFNDELVFGTWEGNDRQRYLAGEYGFELCGCRGDGSDSIYFCRRR